MKLRWRLSSYLQRIDLIPPVLCWLLAREDRKPIPMKTISKRAGLSERRLVEVFSLTTWADIPVKQMDAIRNACGINPSNEARHLFYLRQTLQRDSSIMHHQKRPPTMRMHIAQIIDDPKFKVELDRRYREFGTFQEGQHFDRLGSRPAAWHHAAPVDPDPEPVQESSSSEPS